MPHGHVTPNPDGSKARCGGPAICPECALELARKERTPREPLAVAIEGLRVRLDVIEGAVSAIRTRLDRLARD